MERIFKGRVVVPGEVTLKALVSHGGFNTLASFKDCKEGKNTCTDQNNPDLYGKSTVGVALCLPQTIGSTTGGMVLYNSAVIGCNPGALLFSNNHRLSGRGGRHIGQRLDSQQHTHRR